MTRETIPLRDDSALPANTHLSANAALPAEVVLECRTCGATSPVDEHFCPRCTRILRPGRHGDYFAFLGLPRTLMLDVQDLERRYRDLSRQFHPDYFHNAPSADRLASLERSSYLNDAYRTLRNPIGRVEYLLTLEGRPLSTSGEEPGESTAKAPAAMLAEVFALNEELDEIREAREAGSALDELRSRLAAARRPIDARREQHERTVLELSERWDGLSDAAPQRSEVLDALREQVLARHYISNLLATIEREATAIERSALGDATLADVAAPGTTDQEPSRRG